MAVVSIKNKLRRGNLLVGNTAFDPAAMDSIATVTVGSTSVSSITFSSIPSTYTHLQIRAFVQTNRGTFGTDSMSLTINGDTTASYAYHFLRGNGASAVGASATSLTSISEINTQGCGTTTGGTFGANIIDILDYANTNKFKTLRNLNGTDINGTIGGSPGFISLLSALWQKTNAVTSLVFTPSNGTAFTQYSHFALYGIASA